jgi:MFS transporter, Spinster family, sphingosine-1-phosphate transporter
VTPAPDRRPSVAPPKAPRPHPGSGAYAAYALGLLTLINLFNYADRNVVFAVFEPVKHDLQLSDQQLGWIGSAYIVVLSLAALPLGVLADLRSRRAVIAWGVGLWSLFTSLGGAVRSFLELFVCRAMVGVGEAGYGPVSQALIAEYFSERRRALAIGVYSVGMALGGVLGVWIGGLLAEAYGWRFAFVWMGVPGVVLALLASQLREPRRRPPTPIGTALRRLTTTGLRRALQLMSPLLGLATLGAVAAGILALFRAIPSEGVAAVFAVCVGIGVVWTVKRLVPLAVRQTAQAGQVAATAIEEFGQAATTVLRVPTLVWIFLGGALVTFAVNGLIAWAASFMLRVHGFSVSDVGREFGIWGLAGGALGALTGGRLADQLSGRWPGARVAVSGAGFILGTPVCVALLLSNDLRLFVPLVFGTYFLYTWYNGPLAAVIFDVVPAAVRASVMGAFLLFSHLAGDAIAPPLVGYLSDRLQYVWHFPADEALRRAMLVLPAVGLIGGVVLLVALRTVARDMERVQR